MNKFYIALLFLVFQFGFSAEILQPSATISGGTTVCQNSTAPTITFTGSGGTAPYTFTYTVTGTTGNQTIQTTGTNNSITLAAPTATAGTFTYSLVSVEDSAVGHVPNSVVSTTVVTVSSQPTIDFTFTNDNACSDTLIQFTSLVNGSGSSAYSWDFGDGSPLSTVVNPVHSFTSLGCGITNFTVILTVTRGGCTVTKSHTITVKQKPDINFNDTIHPFDPFSNCSNAASNPVYSITVGNNSTSSCVASYVVNWGDGNTQNNVTFPISHTYSSIGAYSMVITAIGNNGCSNSKTYIIKNVSNPLGGLNSPGSTQNLCAPTANLQFSISNWGSNSLDTTYNINYGDGTSLLLNQNQMVSSSYYNTTAPSNSANYPIPHVYSTSSCPAASYQVTLDVTNACGTTPFTLGNISVLIKPTADFTYPTNACINTSVLFTNTTVAGYGQNCAQSSLYTWDFGDGTPSVTLPIGPPQSINHTFTNSGTYTVTLSAQNFCGTTTKTQVICIEPPLTPLFSLNTTSGCTPVAVTATNNTITTNSCTPPTYLWHVTYASGYCGTSTPVISDQTTQNASYNFTEPGTYTIKLTMTNSCGSFNSSQTVVVKKPPTVSLAAIGNACGTANITPTATVANCAPTGGTLTYAWSFPGGTPSSSTAVNPGSINYPAGGPYTVSLVVTNECGPSNTASQSFTVNTAPVITNTNLSQTICSGSQTTSVNLTSNPGGTTFNWTATATPGITGFTSSGNTATIPAQTITTTNPNPGTVTYVITPTVGACSGSPVNYVITVNPAPGISTQPASSTVCLGGTPTQLSVALTSGTVVPSYQWYSNTTNSTSGGTLISGATSSTYNPPATTVGVLYYYCSIILSSGGCSNLTSAIASVTVNPLPTITTQPAGTQNLCVGSTLLSPLTVAYSGGVGTPTYQWFSTSSPSNTGGTLIAGATTATYTPPVFNIPGTYYFYATVGLSGNGCGNIVSSVAEIIVSNDPTITTQPMPTQTLCQGATPTDLQVSANGGSGTFSYQWFSNLSNNTTGGTAISGATNAIFTPPTAIVGTRYYYCVISQTTAGCGVVSNVAAVIINASPNITLQPQSSSVCAGGTPNTLSFTYSNGVGTPTYQWYSNTNNNNTSGILISGATNATYVPPSITVGVVYYYCLVTFPNLTGSCATIATATAGVTVTPVASIVTQPLALQSFCVGATIQSPFTVSFSNGSGTPSYQWYSNSINSTTGGTPVGTNSANYTPPVFTTAGTYYYYVIITFSGSGCGAITSDIAQIDVIGDPVITSQPLIAQTVCQNSPPTSLSVVASGGIGTAYSYQWYSNVSNTNTGGTLLVGETNNNLTPPTAIAGTLYYYCIITQPSGIGCNVTSAAASVTVNLAPTIVNQPLSSTICLGAAPTTLTLTYANGAGTPNYQWYSNTSNANSGGTSITGATAASFNPPATVAGTLYYYCEITFPAIVGTCSVITSSPAEVTINPYPVIASESTVICSGANFNVTPTTIGGNIIPLSTTYTWTIPTVNPPGTITGGVAENIPQSTIGQTLVNLSTIPATVTYTVTPISGNCAGTPFTVTVTVNPAINPNIIATNNQCFGVNIASITTNITGGIPFSTGSPYQLNWTGPNGFTSTLAAISNLQPGTYNVTIADAGGCPFSNSYIITEPTDIAITTDSINNITCYNAANGSINITVNGGTGNYTYTWTKGGNPYASVEDIANLGPGNYVVSVTDANNCGPKTASFTITEPPQLAVNLVSQVNVLCYGASTGVITVNVSGGTIGSGYLFSWHGPNGFSSANQNLSGITAGTYDLTVTDANGCIRTLSVIITQSSDIAIAYTTTPITCYGANNASLAVTLSGGNPGYTFQWSNLSTSLIQTNLSAGNYTITVTDNVGCVRTETIVIAQAPVFMVNPMVSNVSCFGAHNGSINLNLTGGVAPVALTWSDGSTAGLIRNNLPPGVYSATISDGTPCYIQRTFTIIEPLPLVLSANLTNAFNCTNASTGAIDLTIAGGTMPYTYSWSNGAATEDLANLTSGNYLVTVTDFNGCTATGQYTITRPAPLSISVTTDTDFDCTAHTVDQTFIAQVSGGIPPYNLQWSSGVISGVNNEIMHSNANGTVILTATDSNNCNTNYTLTVDTPVLGYPSFSTSSFGYTTYGLYSINDPIQFQSTLPGDYVSVSWDFGDGTFSTDLNPLHTYLIPRDYVVTQTVTYPFGCIYVQTITLIVEKGYVLVVPTAFTPNGDSLNDTYRPVTKGLKNIVLDIYDTWGSLIYSETGDVLVGWDAKIKGFNAENGNYYSKVRAETFYGTVVNSNQTFVLIK